MSGMQKEIGGFPKLALLHSSFYGLVVSISDVAFDHLKPKLRVMPINHYFACSGDALFQVLIVIIKSY